MIPYDNQGELHTRRVDIERELDEAQHELTQLEALRAGFEAGARRLSAHEGEGSAAGVQYKQAEKALADFEATHHTRTKSLRGQVADLQRQRDGVVAEIATEAAERGRAQAVADRLRLTALRREARAAEIRVVLAESAYNDELNAWRLPVWARPDLDALRRELVELEAATVR